MDSCKERILQLLVATGYHLPSNPDSLIFVESPFTTWFSQNISRGNCVTEEELAEFQLLQENGEVLYGKELDEALKENFDASAVVPVVGVFDDIKRDELEHAQHQLDLQQQLVPILRSSLHLLENDYQHQQQLFRHAQAQQMIILKQLMAANTEFNTKLNIVKETFNTLLKDIIELAPSKELSADEGIDTYSPDKLKSSNFSDSSILTTVSRQSTIKVDNNCKHIFQMSLHKYNKQHSKFCKLLKFVLLERFNKMELKESTPNYQLLLQNIVDRLFQQKLIYMKLSAELAGINDARNKVNETKREIQCHLWNPTQSKLRSKITELDDCSILNGSETSFTEDEEELIQVCKKWADHQTLNPVCDGLKERIVQDQFMLQKLEELATIMTMMLSIDTQLCLRMYVEYDLVSNIIEIYSKVRDWLELRVEASKMRMNLMKENLQDYNEHFINAPREFVECLTSALGCTKSTIPEVYNHLVKQSDELHQEFILSCRQKLQTLASVQEDLKDFYLEEEEKKLSIQRMQNNQDHFDSIRQTLELIATNIESASVLCQTLLENKENIACESKQHE